jgi:hypothetical protein
MRYVSLVAAAILSVGVLAGCHTAPAVSVTPNTGLVDGQEVAINGGGYSANSTVGVVQCPAAADSLDDCDSRTAHTLSTDANGHFRTTMVVRRTITDAHSQQIDCGVAGACVVASVFVHGFQDLATASLQFA